VPDVRLSPFGRRHLPLVEPWFADADTRRWLGGPGWPRLVLDLADRPLEEFRGAQETGRYEWLALDRGSVVGYIDCDTYDRWATWSEEAGVSAVIARPAGSISYVVDPARRRQGYGTAMIMAAMEMPELADVELLTAGVEPANAGSVGCLVKAGFRPLDPEPDWEGIVYYARFTGDRR
jgi:RimJ/RimL family protein N-acetyltransferase